MYKGIYRHIRGLIGICRVIGHNEEPLKKITARRDGNLP